MKVTGTAAAGKGQTGCLREIIAKQMDFRGVTIRELERSGVIKSRGTFWDRIDDGTIRYKELTAVLHFLQIDMVRAFFAMRNERGGQSYFDPVTVTHSKLSFELHSALHELVEAADCDFQPVKRAMCQSMAKKVANDIVEYDTVRRRFNAGEIDFAKMANTPV